jgi:hypothetical protein
MGIVIETIRLKVRSGLRQFIAAWRVTNNSTGAAR